MPKPEFIVLDEKYETFPKSVKKCVDKLVEAVVEKVPEIKAAVIASTSESHWLGGYYGVLMYLFSEEVFIAMDVTIESRRIALKPYRLRVAVIRDFFKERYVYGRYKGVETLTQAGLIRVVKKEIDAPPKPTRFLVLPMWIALDSLFHDKVLRKFVYEKEYVSWAFKHLIFSS